MNAKDTDDHTHRLISLYDKELWAKSLENKNNHNNINYASLLANNRRSLRNK